jgi:PST family polysaccharide transporter
MESGSGGLRRKVLAGLGWRSATDIAALVLQIVFTVVLARLLSRTEFGLVAMGLLATRFVGAMTQVGIGSAVIQSREVTPGQISAVFLLQLGLRTAVAGLCFLGAPLAASFFGEPAVTGVVRALSVAIVLQSLAFPQVVLRKRLAFGGEAALNLGSMIAGNAVGIAAAFLGHGVWALVWRILVQRLVFAAGVWMLARWRPARPEFRGVGKLVRFGLNMLGTNVCGYFARNTAAIVLGRYLGVEVLGTFNIAYSLAITPALSIQGMFMVVLAPAFAKVQGDLARARRVFRESLFGFAAAFVPLMVGLAAVGPTFVEVAYGPRWSGVAFFLVFTAAIGLLKGIEQIGRIAVIAHGRADTIFRITLIETLVGVPLVLAGCAFGGAGVATAFLLTAVLSGVLVGRAAHHYLGARGLVVRATARTLAAAGAMAVAVTGASLLLAERTVAALLLQIAIGVVVYAVARYFLLTARERDTLRAWPLPRPIKGML